MATTSQTYSSNSLIPTSTFTSGSSTPTNSNVPANPISDLFSSAGSPPLIVAFLSIGLFFIAMAGVFGWKRLSRSRGPGDQVILPNRRDRSVSLGEKPLFWDIWADPKVSERLHIQGRRWDNMTPMSAVLTFPIRPSVEPPPTGSTDPNGHGLFWMLRTLVSAVKRFCLPEHRALPPPSLPPPSLSPPPPPPQPDEKGAVVSPTSDTPDEIDWGDVSSLQVSVIITMPAQRQCCDGTSGEDTDQERTELGEFCIGTMDVPWSEGG